MFLSVTEFPPCLSALFWLLPSVAEPSAKLFSMETWPAPPMALVSNRSRMLEIPALSSLRTSEPISDTEVVRENSLSFHPFVLFDSDSLYLKYKKKKLKISTSVDTHSQPKQTHHIHQEYKYKISF